MTHKTRSDVGLRQLPSGLWFARVHVFGSEASKSFLTKTEAREWREELRFQARRAPKGVQLNQGYWQASVDAQGELHQKEFDSFEEAVIWHRDALNRLSRGEALTHIVTPRTLVEYTGNWAGPSGTATHRTMMGYESTLRIHVLPYFGSFSLQKIGSEDLRNWVRFLLENGVSRNAAKKAVALVKQIFSVAMRDGLVTVNPAAALVAPSTFREPARALNEIQVQLLAAAAGPHGDMVRFAYLTGLRVSEMLCLRAGDVDLHSGEIQVQRAWRLTADPQNTGKTIREPGPTKTGRFRQVPLASQLRRSIEERISGALPEQYLFRDKNGRPYNNDWYRKSVIGKAAVEIGVLWVTPKTLRHTFASLLISKLNSPVTVVSEFMGHSTVQQTLNTYAHFFVEDKREWIDQLDSLTSATSEQTRNGIEAKRLGSTDSPAPRPTGPRNKRSRGSGPRQARTDDPRIKSPLLYQLS